MKSFYLGALVLCSAATYAESRVDRILAVQFRQMAEECQMAVDAREQAGKSGADLKSCYSDKVEKTFRELRSHAAHDRVFNGTYAVVPNRVNAGYREKFLLAALKADPILVTTAFNAALDGRMNIYQATRIASAAVPAHEADFSRIAIANGASPDKVTAATAAGRSSY